MVGSCNACNKRLIQLLILFFRLVLQSATVVQVAAAYGCRCFIAMPDDAAIEKVNMLTALGEISR